ncbi:HpcH/HpaI aldolase/citrate lyase family protein [Sphaerotilus mobilis]|uniref:Citrate lyase subunit beta/citryl-CoA lyase n=1 Tax=Sphaerotilus mobilis TaxID=47994 RepID=A0A4Q7LSC3_9BURK|nr:aldolase/citrate lyase family protein [Sphaerotilus mobilis]RZS57242.1 citrate lyase subunit beta/citryl-CoA lyase [Sphaerotilus mobilis]
MTAVTRPASTNRVHPRDALFGAGEVAPSLPACDHYCGVEARMRKSLALQGELGPCFDITLDAEDGAPVGGELDHIALMAELLNSAENRHGRVGARVQAVDHPMFDAMVDALVRDAGQRVAYVMLPKPRGLADLQRGIEAIDAAALRHGIGRTIPVHALVETHGALREVQALAAHPRIESLSFGLMDFVSEHRGAIPQGAMGVKGQFEHPLVVRAKLEIAAACHGFGKTPSHCVVTEFKHRSALEAAATRACRELGYTRMWSIHPDQIRPIVEAFSPTVAEVDHAIEILLAAQAADWAPIRHLHAGQDTLHDRASYRYFWHVLERAHRTSVAGGEQLPGEVRQAFFAA